jgi:hypothetical protein
VLILVVDEIVVKASTFHLSESSRPYRPVFV